MKILVLPDTQCKPGQDFSHMSWAGQYAVDKQPDVIVNIGDTFDMPSLSSYDVGKKSFEGRKYVDDIRAGREAMEAFLAPIKEYNAKAKQDKKKRYKPRMVFCLGNHEQRIERAVESDRKLEGLISYEDMQLEADGWEVVPFLQPIIINGVAFCHYFTSGVMGRPVSSARALLTQKHMSCVMGHVQQRDIAFSRKADGTQISGIFAGCFYRHEEDYLNAQTNAHWRGIWMLHGVENGQMDEMPVSLEYLRNKYVSNK